MQTFWVSWTLSYLELGEMVVTISEILGESRKKVGDIGEKNENEVRNESCDVLTCLSFINQEILAGGNVFSRVQLASPISPG